MVLDYFRRGGEWYPENSGPPKFLFQSRSWVFKSKTSRHGMTFRNSWLIYLIFIYLRISCSSCLAANSFRNRLGFSLNEVSGSVFFVHLGLGFYHLPPLSEKQWLNQNLDRFYEFLLFNFYTYSSHLYFLNIKRQLFHYHVLKLLAWIEKKLFQ